MAGAVRHSTYLPQQTINFVSWRAQVGSEVTWLHDFTVIVYRLLFVKQIPLCFAVSHICQAS